MPSEPIGLTTVIPAGTGSIPVYESTAGLGAFATDDPYLLTDGKTLAAPIPVLDAGGPVWFDANGSAHDALAVTAVPVSTTLIPGPLDITIDTQGNSTIGGTFDLATPRMTLAVVTRYSGTFGTITATHGGQALTLARVDAANGIATAVFYGNNLTIESASLVVAVSGCTLGPSVLRMRDDWGFASIATDWANGKAVSTGSTGYVTTVTPAPRRVLFSRGSESINGSNNVGGSSGASVQYGMRGVVLSGTFASPTGATWTGTSWANVGGEYVHTPYGTYNPLKLAIAPIANQIGAKIRYTSQSAISVRFVRADNSELGMSLPAGSNLTGYVHTVPDGTTFTAIHIHVQNTGVTTIHAVQAISNIVGLHASIGTTVGPAPSGWSIFGSSNPAGDQALSAFTIYNGG